MLISFKPCSVYNNYACLGRSVHIPVLLEYVSKECCVNHMRSISEFICQSYEPVSESAQLWNPMEHTVPCSVSSNVRYHKIFYTWLTPCFHFIPIVALLTVHSCEINSQSNREEMVEMLPTALVRTLLQFYRKRGRCLTALLKLIFPFGFQQKFGQEYTYFLFFDTVFVQTLLKLFKFSILLG